MTKTGDSLNVERLVHVVGADFEERSCPKDTELRNENPQLAYHRTPPCNMYFVGHSIFYSFFSIKSKNRFPKSDVLETINPELDIIV